ncbi:ABC transporter substrate-binding protein [Bacillus rubiinfantis]|uniref:ABC transporter substrate-binding protein n=1 Tax=Bacillus rubiinfantis TaxID=1499680 RepID=UPI0005AA7098|nr:ABC transporter substrate-binding protein [Bacillus rubiinfantis]
MHIAEHYFRLYNHLSTDSSQLTCEITISEIATILFCSNRNAKYIMKELNELQWIDWTPSPGRGKSSKLVFLKPAEAIFYQLAQEKIMNGEFTWCFHQLNYFPPLTRENFFTLIKEFFGFHENTQNHKTIDLLRLPFPANNLELDPLHEQSAEETQLLSHIFDTVVKFNTKENKVDTHLAHHFEFDATGTKLSLFLRKGVFFHNGKELDGHDVKYTYERIKSDPDLSLLKTIFTNINEISVPHPYMVIIQLFEPNHLFLHFLGSLETAIIPRHSIEESGKKFFTKPVGSGPFKVTENNGKRITLEAHSHYFKERPLLDRIEFWFIPEIVYYDSTFSTNLSPIQFTELQEREKGAALLCFNLRKPGICQNKDFRMALQSGINKASLAELSKGSVATDYFLSDEYDLNSFSPDLAKQYLERSGYGGETITLVTLEGKQYENGANLIKKQLDNLGIYVEVKIIHYRELWNEEIVRIGDIFLLKELVPDNLEIELIAILHSHHSTISQLLSKEIFDRINKILPLIYRESSIARRSVQFRRIERLLLNETAVIFLTRGRRRFLFFSSMDSSLQGDGINYNKLWLKPNT